MVRSFGQPAEPDDDPVEGLPPVPLAPAGRMVLEVDLAVSPESLQALEDQLTSLVARAVLAGFSAAAGQQAN